MSRRLHTRLAAALAVAGLAAGCASSSGPTAATTTSGASGTKSLSGLFRVDAGVCAPGGVGAGSWFRMIQPGGKTGSGPFVINSDSSCSDKTWTPLSAGSEGGLRAGSYQAQPNPPFDSNGNSLAGAIVAPQAWFAVKFGVSTNTIDPQTRLQVPAPALTLSGSTISGQLEAFAVNWNGQQFNQGAPKPGGATPGLTSPVKGTYDAATHAYTLDWTSQIVGGPFNNFTGVWHLAGTLQSSS